jgi:DsbE subfamily thiol:disulfide oxidoreductase
VKRWIFVAPIAGFAVLAFFLFRSLWAPPPGFIPSALINKPVPQVVLPALDDKTIGWSAHDLTRGKVVVVNVFSSTCVPCRLEAPVLNALAKQPGVTVFGFVWKDKPADARAFLDEVGNPFTRIGYDGDGRAGLEWGVYGWPETYVVDGKGVIRLKYVGALTDDVIQNQIMPAIKAAELGS